MAQRYSLLIIYGVKPLKHIFRLKCQIIVKRVCQSQLLCLKQNWEFFSATRGNKKCWAQNIDIKMNKNDFGTKLQFWAEFSVYKILYLRVYFVLCKFLYLLWHINYAIEQAFIAAKGQIPNKKCSHLVTLDFLESNSSWCLTHFTGTKFA